MDCETECRNRFPGHIEKATGIILREPSVGYNRTIYTSSYQSINFVDIPFCSTNDSNGAHQCISEFEIDFLGHTSNDFSGGMISPSKNVVCDDTSAQRVTYSNMITTDIPIAEQIVPIRNISPLKSDMT